MRTLLGDRIRELRLERGWTRSQLAEKVGVDSRTIERIETGDTPKPRSNTLQLLADAFNTDRHSNHVDVRELRKIRDGSVPTTSQITTVFPANDEFVPVSEQPSDTVQFRLAVPTRNYKGKVIRIAAISLLAAALLIGGYAFIIHPLISHAMPVHITGTVQCADSERVVGIWIVPSNSDGNYAHWYKTTTNGSEAAFNYDLPNGGTYNVHVGCGGSTKDWQNQDKTEYGSGAVMDYKPHIFICQDIPLTGGDGPCYLKQ